nr:MAG TPA: hypothetical protein [Caudoviricetes sp.]
MICSRTLRGIYYNQKRTKISPVSRPNLLTLVVPRLVRLDATEDE